MIVDMYWRREEEAVTITDKRYGKYLYRIAYNVLKDEDGSRTALDDTYLGAWNSIPPARPQRLLLFLSKIARRVSIDIYRRMRAKKRIPSELLVSLDELSEVIGAESSTERELSAVLNSFLGNLDEGRRRMFVCRYYYSDSVEDIARALGVGASYVYKELARMRKRLAELLREEGFDI